MMIGSTESLSQRVISVVTISEDSMPGLTGRWKPQRTESGRVTMRGEAALLFPSSEFGHNSSHTIAQSIKLVTPLFSAFDRYILIDSSLWDTEPKHKQVANRQLYSTTPICLCTVPDCPFHDITRLTPTAGSKTPRRSTANSSLWTFQTDNGPPRLSRKHQDGLRQT